MLDGLKDAPWPFIRQAHGASTHVPSAIRDLASPNANVREAAYWKLDNYVVLQGDLYEAAAYTAPFLIELLRYPDVPGKDLIFKLLYEIGNGYASPDKRLSFRINPDGLAERYSDCEAPTIRQACRDAVLEGVEVYLSEVESVHSTSRIEALDLLASLYEAADLIIPRLEQVLEEETHPETQGIVDSAIDALRSDSSATRHELT
jgi:hypothetical protein